MSGKSLHIVQQYEFKSAQSTQKFEMNQQEFINQRSQGLFNSLTKMFSDQGQPGLDLAENLTGLFKEDPSLSLIIFIF